MRFSMCAALASVPLWALLLFTDSKPLLLTLNCLLFALAISWLGPAAADVHDIAGPHLRGLGIGIYFSTVNICAYGIGSPLIGKLSDLLGVSSNPGVMRYSLLVCLVACLLSAVMLWRGSQSLQKLDGRAQ
jgi:predicted MFS family arabinose efflux permease